MTNLWEKSETTKYKWGNTSCTQGENQFYVLNWFAQQSHHKCHCFWTPIETVFNPCGRNAKYLLEMRGSLCFPLLSVTITCCLFVLFFINNRKWALVVCCEIVFWGATCCMYLQAQNFQSSEKYFLLWDIRLIFFWTCLKQYQLKMKYYSEKKPISMPYKESKSVNN